MRFLVLLLIGCAPKVPRVPGPLGAVGRQPHVIEPIEAPTVAPPEVEPPPRRARPDAFQQSVVSAARRYLEVRPEGFRDDCSGYVSAVFDRAGVRLTGGTRDMYALAEEQHLLHHRKEPRPGDLAFFDDTYDANRDGRTNDPLTHVAVVLEVDDDGTIHLAHGGTGRGRTTLTMNLYRPDERSDGDHVLNDWLRRQKPGDPSNTHYFAGELWRAFATVDPDAVSATE
ncbi:MAG: CHAP domain-containing protein [Alphaproteobacteria bacterium]|nr:CHAP domain-containing protein [Alphaproteobacteria bacterium]